VRIPETKYKRSNSIFFLTHVGHICASLCTQLLHPLAQSLIVSPGSLVETPDFFVLSLFLKVEE